MHRTVVVSNNRIQLTGLFCEIIIPYDIYLQYRRLEVSLEAKDYVVRFWVAGITEESCLETTATMMR